MRDVLLTVHLLLWESDLNPGPCTAPRCSAGNVVGWDGTGEGMLGMPLT